MQPVGSFTSSCGMIFITVALMLAGCGGGGGEGGSIPPNPMWVYAESPNDKTVVAAGQIEVRGTAYCDACPSSETAVGYCPDILPPRESAVNITWTNRTTGATGNAVHGIRGSCDCLFSYCFTSYSHTWVIYSLPLAIGDNLIEIRAEWSGRAAVDTLTVTRIPVAPEGVSATAGTGAVTVQWDSVAGATSYDLYWSNSAALTKDTATRIPGVSSPYVHSGLTDNLTYYYFVTAVSGVYESPASQTVSATPGWSTEAVAPATTTTGMKTAIAVDSSGTPHIHYAYDECLHYTVVDGISFCDSHAYHNYYATTVAGAWITQQLPASIYSDANIAVDSDDTVHVSYVGPGGLDHATYTAGTWNWETVDGRGWCDSSFALDQVNNGHAAYYVGGELWYATDASGTWVTTVVTAFSDIGCSGDSGRSLAVVADRTGTASIVYAGRYPDYGLNYATKHDAAWDTGTVDAGYVPNVSAAVDGNGKVHVAYRDNANTVKYAHQDSTGSWSIEVVKTQAWPGHPSLALDTGGNPHISYIAGDGKLEYATKSNGTWRMITVHENASTDTALALDSRTDVHITYFSAENLMYATNRQ